MEPTPILISDDVETFHLYSWIASPCVIYYLPVIPKVSRPFAAMIPIITRRSIHIIRTCFINIMCFTLHRNDNLCTITMARCSEIISTPYNPPPPRSYTSAISYPSWAIMTVIYYNYSGLFRKMFY